jgi:hypothetical protein
MTTSEPIDPTFAAGLRNEAISFVRQRPRRWRLSRRLTAGAAGCLVLVGGGVALAAGVLTQPGGSVTTNLGTAVTVTRTGTATINLGPRPASANDVSLTLTCDSAGTFGFPGGNVTCTSQDLSEPAQDRQASITVGLRRGQHSITVSAAATATWTLRADYVHQSTTVWGVNAHGQTYGAINEHGTPDLVAVDNGQVSGYVKASEMNCASGGDVANPAQAQAWDRASADREISIPVYKSDGTTIVGTFVIGGARGADVRVVPLASAHLDCKPRPRSPARPRT